MDFLYLYPERYGAEGNMLDAGPVAEIAAAVEAAGFDGIAFTEHPASIIKATDEVERHAEAFRALEAAGATGIIISGTQVESPTQTLEFLDTFGATYLR